jgi:nucleoside-diphosphate-sugar epimerase
MAIMITGGTGFLGSYLTRHLVREKGIMGKDLVLFDRYPTRTGLPTSSTRLFSLPETSPNPPRWRPQ